MSNLKKWSSISYHIAILQRKFCLLYHIFIGSIGDQPLLIFESVILFIKNFFSFLSFYCLFLNISITKTASKLFWKNYVQKLFQFSSVILWNNCPHYPMNSSFLIPHIYYGKYFYFFSLLLQTISWSSKNQIYITVAFEKEVYKSRVNFSQSICEKTGRIIWWVIRSKRCL